MSPRAGPWLALLLPLSATPSAAAEETFLGCRAIEDAEQRLACYDRVVDRLRAPAPPEAPAQEPRAAASEAPAATASEQGFGRTMSQRAKAIVESFGSEAPEELASRVTTAQLTGAGLYVISLENGQVWRQEEAVSFRIRSGDTAEIKAGALGAFYLRRNGKGRAVRVTRVE
jgi:hypothetical protein